MGIIGNYGFGNFGDDLIAKYVLTRISKIIPTERIFVYAPQDCYLTRWFPGIHCVNLNELYYPPAGTIRKLVFGGGGLFFALRQPGLSNLWGIRGSTTLKYFWLYLTSDKSRLQFYAYCIGLSDLMGKGAWWITEKFLTKFDQISLRFNRPEGLVSKLKSRVITDASLGLKDDILVYGSLNNVGVQFIEPVNFGFDKSNPYNSGFGGTPPNFDNQNKSVCIVVRYWKWQDLTNLINNLHSAAVQLRSTGWQVQFVSFQPYYDKRILIFLQSKGETIYGWYPDKDTIPQFSKFLSQFKVMVSMRAHGILWGSILGIIPIAIKIDPKMESMLAMCSLAENILETSSTVTEIVRKIELAVKQPPVIKDWTSDLRVLEDESRRLETWLLS